MKKEIILFLLFNVVVAQMNTDQPLLEVNDSVSVDQLIDSETSIPQDLLYGYKGFEWGSSGGAKPDIDMSRIGEDSNTVVFSGVLGIDSVLVTYFFADSGFWKVEIDFIIDLRSIDKYLLFFARLEKNISEIYGPTINTMQIQRGPGPAYANSIYPKFSRAYYRSTWSSTPVMIELLLNALELLPMTDLPIFSGNFSVLKLVYYNPDYMISSHSLPTPRPLPSIFDIY